MGLKEPNKLLQLPRVLGEIRAKSIQEPEMKFGYGKKHVLLYESRTLLKDSGNAMLYAGFCPKEKEVIYGFKDGILQSCIVVFNIDITTIATDVARFYAENYRLTGVVQNTYLFESYDKKITVAVSTNEHMGLHAIYYKNKVDVNVN
ncbi:hypothetical protein ACFSQ3_00215 [Sphingobacterium corticis]|uniref:Uncharacterized protein n=1 Tax=Sphingobacterium corticis TaxID=1812823 RepID=A0ABW5NFA2_9SPHI